MLSESIRLARLTKATIPTRRLSSIAQNDHKTFHIPVIDFSRFREAHAKSEKKDTADRIVSAFKDSGFVYLSGHGIPLSASESLSRMIHLPAD